MQFHGFSRLSKEQRPKIRLQGKSLSKTPIDNPGTGNSAFCRLQLQSASSKSRAENTDLSYARPCGMSSTPRSAVTGWTAAERDHRIPSGCGNRLLLRRASMYRWRKIIISSVKNQTSIRLAQKALRLAPDNLEALELLAAAYEKDNRLSDSIKAYESILRLNPHDNRDPLQSDRFAAVDR